MNLKKRVSKQPGIKVEEIMDAKSPECIQILNEIDFLLTHSSTVPLMAKTMVDAQKLFELSEAFRKAFPKELEESSVIIDMVQDIMYRAESKADLMLKNAEHQAQSIIEQAQQEASNILNESRLLKEAQQQAELIVNEAIEGRELIKKEAEEFLKSAFTSAERYVEDTLISIQNARLSVESN